MKTKEELNALKEEVEELNKKLAGLTGEELAQVTGGIAPHSEHVIPCTSNHITGGYMTEPGREIDQPFKMTNSEAERKLIPENTETVLK